VLGSRAIRKLTTIIIIASGFEALSVNIGSNSAL